MQDHTHKKKAALQKQKKTCIEHSHAIVITHTQDSRPGRHSFRFISKESDRLIWATSINVLALLEYTSEHFL